MTPDEFAGRLRKIAVRDGITFATLASLDATDRSVLVATIAAQFDPNTSYAERAVNDRLQAWLDGVAANVQTDRVTLRRWLVDIGEMSRASDCTNYRMIASVPLREVASSLDCAEIAAGVRDAMTARRAARKESWLQSAGGASNSTASASRD